MGLFQKAVETYDANARIAGVYMKEGSQDQGEDDRKSGSADEAGREKKKAKEEEPLVPIAHSLMRADVVITLSPRGEFKGAVRRAKDDPKAIIPVTEESAGRSGKLPPPHPLCDKLEYIAPGGGWRHEAYLKQLSSWAKSDFSCPLIEAVLSYVEAGTVLEDLADEGIVSLEGKGASDAMKLKVCWEVSGIGGQWGECWKNQGVFESFIRWYSFQIANRPTALCMVEGDVVPVSENHPKGIVPLYGNAKLISANDHSGFTYRGRFKTSSEAATVGYRASQKAHNALRWLIANQKAIFGGRTHICWNPQGIKIPMAWDPLVRSREPLRKPSDYGRALNRTLAGYRSGLPEEEDVVIATFDAATENTGRLALVYFNDLMGSDYLQRLRYWDEICCWRNGKFGIQSPALRDIVSFAFGTRQEKGEARFVVDDKVMGMHMQRLIRCRVDRARMPVDVKDALVERVSKAALYDRGTAMKAAFIACAVIRKYRMDHYGEDVGMELDERRPDRSYQFGRLLALFDAAERSTFGPEDKGRLTNAERIIKRFRARPMSAVERLRAKSIPYFGKMEKLGYRGSRIFFEKEIEQVFKQIAQFPDADVNKRIGETYLLGYYLEQDKIYQKRSNDGKDQDNKEE